MENRLFKKIAACFVGLTLTLGVGVVASHVSRDLVRADAADGNWTLVKDASTLEVGDQVIIAAKGDNYAMSTNQGSNNRGQAAITKNGDTISAPSSSVQIFTLKSGKSTGTFSFYTGKGYIYAASSSKNYLRTETTLSANSSWKISIASTGVATIKATGSSTRNWLQYNKASSLFSAYSRAQQDVALYKFIETAAPTDELVGITITGTPKSSYYIGDAWSHEGLVVTAEWKIANPSDVSSEVSWTYKVNDKLSTHAADGDENLTIIAIYEEKEYSYGPISVTVIKANFDKLTNSDVGSTETQYNDWEAVKEYASYSANSAGSNNSIQLNTTKKTSGIVTKSNSQNKVVSKIVVSFHTATTTGRIVDIYAKDTPYSSPSDLYDTSKQGTKISANELVYNGTVEKEFDIPTEKQNLYIGIKSNDGAIYLDYIKVFYSDPVSEVRGLSFDKGDLLEIFKGNTETLTLNIDGSNLTGNETINLSYLENESDTNSISLSKNILIPDENEFTITALSKGSGILTASYGEITASIAITVLLPDVLENISLQSEGETKTAYFSGEKFDNSSYSIIAQYEGKVETRDVTNFTNWYIVRDTLVSINESLVSTDTQIKVSYTEGDVTKDLLIDITVEEIVPVRISWKNKMSGFNNIDTFWEGETIKNTQLGNVYLVKNNKEEEELPIEDCKVELVDGDSRKLVNFVNGEYKLEKDDNGAHFEISYGEFKEKVYKEATIYVVEKINDIVKIEGSESVTNTASTTVANYASSNGWNDSTKYTNMVLDENVSINVTGGANTGKYYANGHNWRIYQTESPKITVSANEATITSVKVTYSVSNNGVLKFGGSNVNSGTVIPCNDSSIEFNVGNTASGTNGQVRITAIEVTYKIGGEIVNVTYSNQDITAQKAALDFVEYFHKTLACDANGNTESISANWSSISEEFNKYLGNLDESQQAYFKALFAYAVAANPEDENYSKSDSLQLMLEKYNYVFKKYGASEQLVDFLYTQTNRTQAPSSNANISLFRNAMSGNNSAALIVVISSIVSVCSLAYFFINKKKKENTNK